MVIVSEYELILNPVKGVFVRSLEQSSCPCCSGLLKVIGSRKRSCIDGAGEKILLVVRRPGCTECRRIHHELPDMLVPYKRHVAESIEAVIIDNSDSAAADESTIKRWRTWFNEMAHYFEGCLKSISIRYGKDFVEDKSALFKSRLQRESRGRFF